MVYNSGRLWYNFPHIKKFNKLYKDNKIYFIKTYRINF